MFYEMIERKCDAWYASERCTVRGIIDYIEQRGKLRDAQIGAIRMYLFLKIEGEALPLAELFCRGFFNTLRVEDFETRPMAHTSYELLHTSPAFRALYEYSLAKDEKGRLAAPQLAEAIEQGKPIDAAATFRRIFGEKTYPEYLFSLPMGAGKTFLMAAFIYLDLYYAMMEPENPHFAHNFIVLAPSGLKSSVVPSLRTIREFDPSWVLPEPAATQVKRLVHFEVLDAQSAQKRSNKTRNPNVQKIARYADQPDSLGLIAVTNAEKVILDRVKIDASMPLSLFGESEEDRLDRQANELRNRIGKLPHLAIFIDEAHHAADDDIKLRQVVNQWVETGRGVTNVIGFSGTPYLQKKEKLALSDGLAIAYDDIPSIVYYYSLVDGIGNFLKRPTVHKAAPGMESVEIVNRGVREFLKTYGETRYADGTVAKLAIFCANIAALEGLYSDVAAIVAEHGMDPAETILKFHRGNKEYPMPEGAQLAFDSLDTAVSKKRIILLAGIGKEGWDCRSLTGVILSQKNACPTNKVLQTSCRCLRQVTKGEPETALIYLCADNEKTLAAQLQKQQHMTVQEFQQGTKDPQQTVRRYDRTQRLALPPVHYRQMRIEYTTEIAQKQKDIAKALRVHAILADSYREDEVTTQDLAGHVLEHRHVAYGDDAPRPANFQLWVHQIAKESFGTLPRTRLLDYETALHAIFAEITRSIPCFGGMRCYRNDIDQSRVRSNIRVAFVEDWHDVVREEIIPMEAQLLVMGDHFDEEIVPQSQIGRFYPSEADVEKILAEDAHGVQMPEKARTTIEALQELNPAMAEELRRQYGGYVGKDRSFHYLPYRTDSAFERTFLAELLPEDFMEQRHLECYYNGDRRFTELRIRCYEKIGQRGWNDIGLYTPDFLVLHRTGNAIDRVLIVETKGRLYANDPAFQRRRAFMETLFKEQNPNFDYLYLEDGLSDEKRRLRTRQVIERFFATPEEEA